jgi:hypothetical protein
MFDYRVALIIGVFIAVVGLATGPQSWWIVPLFIGPQIEPSIPTWLWFTFAFFGPSFIATVVTLILLRFSNWKDAQ